MTVLRAIPTLERWCALLEALEAVELDVSLSKADIEQRLAQRQNTIDEIQTLDAELAQIAEMRRAGWSAVPVEHRQKAEALVERGRAILARTMEKDAATIEKAKEIRTDLLGQLKSASLTRGYDPSSRAPTYRPPLIVDDKA